MRAGAWAATRDIVAAWASWERARQVADALPADDADRTAMRIAARALAVRQRLPGPCRHLRRPFSRSCESCARRPGTSRRWPSAWPGWWQEHMRHGRVREASRLASETMALVESIGDADA